MNQFCRWFITRVKKAGYRITAASGCIVLAAQFAACGCFPVPNVMGRPPAVQPRGESELVHGGSLWYLDRDGVKERDHDEIVFGNYHGSSTVGLGHGIDFSFGVNNAQVFTVARWQLLGEPRNDSPDRPWREIPVDLSVEAGAGFTLMYGGQYTQDTHLGVSLGVPIGAVTPYVGFRHHWVDLSRWEVDPDRDFREGMRQHMFFFGVHIVGSFPKEAHGMTIEFYYGRSENLIPQGTEWPHETMGVNVVFGWPDQAGTE